MNIVMFTPKGWQFAEDAVTSVDIVTKINGKVDEFNKLILSHRPEIVMIGGFKASDELLSNIKALTDALPQSMVVICTEKTDSQFLLDAMRDGVREVISQNTAEEIAGVIARAKSHLKNTGVDTSVHHGQKFGFISAKGGDGGTCIVANIAAALAKEEKNRIVVVDLSLRYGDVEIYLTNKSITNNLVNFSSSVDRLDATLLDLMVHHVSDNLHLIPSPSTLEDILRVKIDDVEKLIDILALHYDYVLIDVGTGLDPISIRTWDKLDKLVLTSTMTIPSARRTSQILRLWENMGLSANKAYILLSRCGGPSDLTLDEYEQAVGKKVWHMVYREFMGIQQSLLKGIPVIDLKPSSKFTNSVLDIASEWNGKPIKRKFSLWAYLGIR
jgi:pilus assembly protein CpaE